MAERAPPLLLLANKRRMSTKVWPLRYSVGFFRGRLSERIARGRVTRCSASQEFALRRIRNPMRWPAWSGPFLQKTRLVSSIALAHLQARHFRLRRSSRMLLLPIRFADGLNGLQFFLFQRAVDGGQLAHELLLDLLDDVLQLAAQYFRALNLRSGRRPVVAIHVAINRGQEFAQPFLAGDGAAFFGSHDLRTDFVRRSGKLGETLAQRIVCRQRAGPLGGGVANSDDRIDRPAHVLQHVV